ncbi:MAG: hypothetical protein VX589_05930 [Myxococcota bacterium]|nr:hypothetical protein [Myxococcota bacterium]
MSFLTRWTLRVLIGFGVFSGNGTGYAQVQPWPKAEFARGVVYSSWDGTYRKTRSWRADLIRFKDMGVNWIQIMTFARQPSVNQPFIETSTGRPWPRAFVRAARQAGFRILLKPHVWSPQFYDGSKRWRGSIQMPTAADWSQWFKAYEQFIVTQARFAEEMGIEMLSVGLEYVEATKHTAAWRALIKSVRSVYRGQLTYAADGNHESDHIAFWDDLDLIGMNGYFALSAPNKTTVGRLLVAWWPRVATLAMLAARYARPIIFTEAGYPSVQGSIRSPWQWPSGTEVADAEGQRTAYEALLEALTPNPWFRGVFWWKYYEHPEGQIPLSHDYTPRHKPAEKLLETWYRQPSKAR